jgi:YD repeat-containing protein
LIFARTGYISRALAAWDEAWRLAKDATDPAGRAVADVAVAEWLDLVVNLGKVEAAAARVSELEHRQIGGSAGARVAAAREGLRVLQDHHNLAVASGALAVEAVLRIGRPDSYQVPSVVSAYHPTPAGTSLTALKGLAAAAGLKWQSVYRASRDADVVVPSIVHFRSGHYTAVVQAAGNLSLLRDPILGGEMWVTREALIDEGSGYALIPESSLPPGWRDVADGEGDAVIGHCAPGGPASDEPCDGDCTMGGNGPDPGRGPDGGGGPPPGGSGPPPPPGGPEPPCATGMPVYTFHPVKASLLISDVPLGYSPPRGPAVRLRLSYDHRDASNPQTFTFSNLGAMWTFDWLSHVTEAPAWCPLYYGSCLDAHVTVFLRGSGKETYKNPDAQGTYPASWRSRAVLVRVSNDPVRYERRLADGSVEVFALADGAPAGQRRIFMTEMVDPQGQRLQFSYDAQFRLVAVTDAVGQVTTLAYDHATDPLKITSVTDPFGRTATLTYNAAGQLESITDVIGLTSRFAYGPTDFITSLTTPYGRTSFRQETTNASPRFIEATDAMGGTERLEFHFEHASLAAAEPSAEVPTGSAGTTRTSPSTTRCTGTSAPGRSIRAISARAR